ncbi:hypothetical protein PROFUN_15317 [Planoprotostelium fungivorum]|uniref:Major facilitator superfamily (MFS) profile domain-containing protein n=1 Tax=Planoprotostelium fungivorum TaxID=1890364 RepID=A0A2P6MWY5_9EUKA|nr:hypothetical protein PROFUN_15317 [Planoprotostelium fungivorum]
MPENVSSKYTVLSPGKEDDPEESFDGPSYTIGEAIATIGFGKQQWMLFLVSGLCWIADAFEVMLLTYLLPAVQKEWSMNGFWESTVASISFFGMLFGSPFWGLTSDRFGRRVAFFGSAAITAFFGLLSAFSPNVGMLILFRFLVGFGVSGSHVAFSLFVEFLPLQSRGRCLIALQAFWTLGTVLESALAWLVLPTMGWRWLLALSAIPMVLLVVFYFFIPESPRYLMQCGRIVEAEQVLQAAAKKNGVLLPEGRLILPEEEEQQKGKLAFMSLIRPTYLTMTITLWIIWFCNAFSYFGIILVTPEYFEWRGDGGSSSEQEIFLTTFITSVAEFPGLLITAFAVDRIGRKKAQASLFGVCGVFTLFLCYKESFAFSTFTAIVSRMCISGAYAATWLYTPEIYPTHIRSTGLGVCNVMAKLAGLCTPYVAHLFNGISLVIPIVFYAVGCFIGTFAAIRLPQETSKMDIK